MQQHLWFFLARVFAPLPRAWLREAELSFSQQRPERLGFQTRLGDLDDVRALVAGFGLDPAPVLDVEARVRAKLGVSPSHWVKTSFVDERAIETSQYFLVDGDSHYPISTLRVFPRLFGRRASPHLERVLEPALDDRATRWGLALKPAGPAIFCHLSRACLEAVFERLSALALVDAADGARLLSLCDALHGLSTCFLTVDPDDPSRLAVDVEDPARPGAAAGWLEELSPRPPRYLKCRVDGRMSAYYPWPELAQDRPTSDPLADIRAYYEQTHDDYLTCVGTTFQAALLGATPQESNQALGERAGLRAGMRVLDAGCGVCGPAIDLARAVDVEIDAVTVCDVQVETAREAVEQAGLSQRVRVRQADFHALPFEDASFDAVVMFESASYSHDPRALLSELFRVLRPGGVLYVKDFFVEPGACSPADARALHEYDFTYCTQTRSMSQMVKSAAAVGFEAQGQVLTDVSLEHFHNAMMEQRRSTVGSAFLSGTTPKPSLSRFGVYHRRSWKHLPVQAGEIVGRRPPVGTHD